MTDAPLIDPAHTDASEWPEYQKVTLIRAYQMPHAFRVRTVHNEIASGEAGDYLCCSGPNDWWPHKREPFERAYRKVSDGR
jgi:predicted dehydrogenase